MSNAKLPTDPQKFSEILYEKMKCINPGVSELELYEFRYGLNNLEPLNGDWASIQLEDCGTIERRVNDIEFYRSIQIKPLSGNRIILDPPIVSSPICYSQDWSQAIIQ